MANRGWLEVSIKATPFGREVLRAILEAHQIRQSEDIVDEQEIFRALNETAECWDYIDERALLGRDGDLSLEEPCRRMAGGIRFYVPNSDEGWCQLDKIREHMDRIADQNHLQEHLRENLGENLGSWEVSVLPREDEDWDRIWKESFRGFVVGERLFVKPCWEVSGEGDVRDRLVLELEVGGSFGTGDHASTRLCLEWLESHVRPHTYMSLLDIGCGSGILFVAALLLGVEKALAVDIDPHAVAEAIRNAHLNALQPWRYQVMCGNVFDLDEARLEGLDFLGFEGADVIVANVTTDVIMGLGDMLQRRLKPDGVFLASGIIDSRWPEIEGFLRERKFTLLHKAQNQGWVAAVARKAC